MSKKLLLADDSITIQKVIGITFANEDYELSVVDNGNEALEMARTVVPDLILADVFMPGKNGYELCAAVKNDPSLGGIPVLLLTGTFEPFDEKKAKAVGADSWIAKPFESQALIDKVEELLSREPTVARSIPEPEEETETFGEAAAEITDGLAETASPEVSEDIWGQLEESEISLPGDDSSIAEADSWEADGGEAEGDLWGDFSIEEEPANDLGGEFELEAGEADANWGEAADPIPGDSLQEESDFTFEEDSFSEDSFSLEAGAAETPLEEEWEAFGEDILPLDEDDILEEEDLAAAEEPTFVAEEEHLDLPADLTAEDEAFAGAEATLPEEEEWGDGEEPDLSVADPKWETFAGDMESTAEAAPELPVEMADIAPAEKPSSAAADAPATAPATDAAAMVATRISSLGEEEIARIVEKVAGAVIERLAQSMLEKIAWEVVPDLAESMVKEEIRKIRESVQ